MRIRFAVFITISIVLNLHLATAQVIFNESFDEANGSTSGSADGVSWTSTCSTCMSGDIWEVVDGVFQNNDSNGPAYWESETINISSCSEFKISFDIIQDGDFEPCGTGCNAVDYVSLEYTTDVSADQTPANSFFCTGGCAGLNVVAAGNLTNNRLSYSTDCIQGANMLQIKIGTQTWSGSEFISIDNIKVTCCCDTPELKITPPPPICASETTDITQPFITEGSEPGILSYWKNSTATDTLADPDSISVGGIYYIQLGQNECSNIKPVPVMVNASISADAGDDIEFCPDTAIMLGGNPTGPAGSSYLWTPLDSNQFLDLSIGQNVISNPILFIQDSLDEPQSFVVVVTKNGCTESDTISVIPSQQCIIEYDLPNVFSPNNDGINDIFRPIQSIGIDSVYMKVFNRWGKKAFETEDVQINWDGGQHPDGVYYYHIIIRDVNGNIREQRGNILLMR